MSRQVQRTDTERSRYVPWLPSTRPEERTSCLIDDVGVLRNPVP